jgi:hypothetical protein
VFSDNRNLFVAYAILPVSALTSEKEIKVIWMGVALSVVHVCTTGAEWFGCACVPPLSSSCTGMEWFGCAFTPPALLILQRGARALLAVASTHREFEDEKRYKTVKARE